MVSAFGTPCSSRPPSGIDLLSISITCPTVFLPSLFPSRTTLTQSPTLNFGPKQPHNRLPISRTLSKMEEGLRSRVCSGVNFGTRVLESEVQRAGASARLRDCEVGRSGTGRSAGDSTYQARLAYLRVPPLPARPLYLAVSTAVRALRVDGIDTARHRRERRTQGIRRAAPVRPSDESERARGPRGGRAGNGR